MNNKQIELLLSGDNRKQVELIEFLNCNVDDLSKLIIYAFENDKFHVDIEKNHNRILLEGFIGILGTYICVEYLSFKHTGQQHWYYHTFCQDMDGLDESEYQLSIEDDGFNELMSKIRRVVVDFSKHVIKKYKIVEKYKDQW